MVERSDSTREAVASSDAHPELGESWSGRVYLDGGLWPEELPWFVDGVERTGESWFAVELEAAQTRRFVLTAPSEAGFSGWMTVTANPGVEPEVLYNGDNLRLASGTSSISVSLLLNLYSGGVLMDSVGVPPAEAGTIFAFPVENPNGSRPPGASPVNTGIAIRSFDGVLMTLDLQGGVLPPVVLEWDEDRTASDSSGVRLLDELFQLGTAGQPAFDELVGYVWVGSSRPFFVWAGRLVLGNGTIEIASLPVTRLR